MEKADTHAANRTGSTSDEPNQSRASDYNGGRQSAGRAAMSDQLDPVAPAEAIEWYFQEREPDLSKKTLQNQRYRLNSFLDWCKEHGLEDMNELTGRDLHRYRTWRSEDVNRVTLAGQLQTLRKFLEFCAAIDAVEPGMRERVHIPDLETEEESRDEKLPEDRAEVILKHLEKFRYASREHIILALLWHTGVRLGTLRALDVEDFDPEAKCLKVRHRPDTETPLKNKHAAERSIAVGEYYCKVISDYIEHTRDTVVDDHGRRPLITSQYGRLSEGMIRETVYQWTRPCEIGGCPHDRDPDTCEAMEWNKASQCPSSRSPHSVRRGSITKHLRDGTPQEVVSDRMNASKEILDQHYDARTEREKMEVRREFLKDV